jgi:hypothetical protein
MGLMVRGLACLSLLLPTLAFAQDLPPNPYEPPPPPGAPLDPAPGLREDPHIDRAWFSPTAMTQPAGTFSFNSYELVLLGLTYGVTDSFQLSAITLPPYVEDIPFVGYVSGKLSLPLSGRVRLGGSLGLGLAAHDGDTGTFGILGGALSICTDEPCASLVSFYLYAGFFLEESEDVIPIGYGASLIQRLGRRVKLVLDVGSGGVLASNSRQFAEGVVVSYGLRFFTGNIAGDIGLIRPIFFNEDVDMPFILGVPAVTFSYRWGGD